jgi:hypothetical protein
MRALTLHPEWAHAIAHLGKRIENRPWKPPEKLLGERIAIHAGKSVGGRPGFPAMLDGCRAVAARDPLTVFALEAGEAYLGTPLRMRLIETSAIIATARLDGWSDAEGRAELPAEATPPDAWRWGDPTSPFWWHLSDVRLVVPVPCRGSLGLWTVPEDVVGRLVEVCG